MPLYEMNVAEEDIIFVELRKKKGWTFKSSLKEEPSNSEAET